MPKDQLEQKDGKSRNKWESRENRNLDCTVPIKELGVVNDNEIDSLTSLSHIRECQ